MSPGVTVTCSVTAKDTLAMYFTSVSQVAGAGQSVQVAFTNFNNPFSSQILKTINVRYYSDQYCTAGRSMVGVPAVTVQQLTMPSANIQIVSSSNVLGEQTPSNTLTVTFTPVTTMAPGGAGSIDILVPMWYQIAQTGQFMYNSAAKDKCSSSCMKITSSGLNTNGAISIDYANMIPSCITGSPITISCRQFYNPVEPRIWQGFSVTLYDSEKEKRIIEQSKEDAFLDATNFLPATIPTMSVDPTNQMVQSFSKWTIQLTVNIPLMTNCWIQLFLPADFAFTFGTITASGLFQQANLSEFILPADVQIIYKNGGTIPQSSVFFQGCNSLPSLGSEPFGRLDIQSIQTQSAIKDSQSFGLKIFKDQAKTQLIANLAQGVIVPALNLKPGPITIIEMYPSTYLVQANTSITFAFTTSHSLQGFSAVTIRLPPGIGAPTNGTLLKVTSPDNSTAATQAVVLIGNQVQVINLVSNNTVLAGNSTIKLTLSGLTNPFSAKDAGDYQITTQLYMNGSYYTVDQQTAPNSYVPRVGTITPTSIEISNPTNSANLVTYSLTFTLQNSVPKAGYIQVQFPSEIVLSPSTTLSTASCKNYTCLNATASGVKYLIANGMSAGSNVTLQIGGAANPRSFKPTEQISISSLDTDGVSQIDVGIVRNVSMTIAGPVTSFSAIQTNFTNGNLNTYTFSVQAVIPIVPGDMFTFTFPAEIGVPSLIKCVPLSNVIDMSCVASGKKVTMTLRNFTQPNGAFSWSLQNIQNPGSTKPSSSFTDVSFVDQSGYTISTYTNATSVTNKQPANLLVYSINQTSLVPRAITNYSITFTPTNMLPTTGSIQMTYPSQLTLTNSNSTVCTITTSVGSFSDKCIVDDNSRTITITNAFSKPQSGPVTIQIQQVQNAVNNKPSNGFVIQTYWDGQQTYIMDKLNDFILLPQFQCDYPCQTCTQRNQCTSCWSSADDPQYIMAYLNGTQTCRPSCDLGSSSNGSPIKQCVPCDQSCVSCRDNGIVGDYKQCITCAPLFPLRVSQTDICLSRCSPGMFQSSNQTCSMCKSPCLECAGSEATCTSCNMTSPTPFLFVNQCINQCPSGYVSVKGICTKCNSPCALCVDTPDSCVTCDGSGGTKFVYNKTCYQNCPPGSGPNPDTLTCFPCLKGCDLCDITNITQCLKCTPPQIVYIGNCTDTCPVGWVVNIQGTACRPWQLSDLGTIPFPFLIAAAVLTVICLFGLMRKQAYLSHGKMATRSPQHTITCIIVALAPLQFLATICQWIMSYLYGTMTFAILALIVTVAAVILNIVFQINFQRAFNSKKIPAEIDRRVRLGKMTKADSQKYKVERDDKFQAHKRQYRCTSSTIFTLTAAVNFKFNKAYYSFFYNMPKFQCLFTQAKHYRKMMTWYQIIYLICIDLSLICIDVTGLTKIEPGNQLWITMIETLVLSVLSIILGAIELWKLKDILQYTAETVNKKSKLNTANTDSEDEKDLDKKFDKTKMKDRREMMGSLLKQVKYNKALFLNNKLDELLTQFGDRKCKSMHDLATGWILEDDPRLIVTWPVSPMMAQDYDDLEIKFTKEDAYGAFANNVYADAKSKFMGMDFGTQDDAGFMEFQDALNRKAGGIFGNHQGDIEERRLQQRNRKRGRKNKYYAQIDQEDDAEAEMLDDEVNRDKVIREQQDEEDQMRRQVQQEALNAQQAALLRKQQLESEKQQRLLQDKLEEEKRQLEQQVITKQLQKQQLDQIAKLKQEVQSSQQLQKEALKEKEQREKDEKAKIEAAAKESAARRAEYELQEQQRLKLLALQKEEKAREMELKRLKDIEDARVARQKVIDDQNKLQKERDEQELLKKKQIVKGEQEQREREKEAKRLEKERLQSIKDEEQAQKQQLLDQDRIEKENQRIKKQLAKDEEERLKRDKEQAKLMEKQQKEQLLLQQEQDREMAKAARVQAENEQAARVQAENEQAARVQAENEQARLKVRSAVDDREAKVQSVITIEEDRKDNYSLLNQTMNGADNIMSTFVNQNHIDAPPSLALRTFNHNDILGDLDRDSNGNVVTTSDPQGINRDKQGNRTNINGYLVDPASGDVIENVNGQVMFPAEEMDERGEVPGQFCVEKYNFNPHLLMGDFDFQDGKPSLMQTNQGFFLDKKSRRVNKHGWMVLGGQGHLVDYSGRKKFDKSELTKDQDLPKLFNYQGKRFDIHSVMGIFEKDQNGRIVPQTSLNGLVDCMGRPCNDKGYLVDKQGNIIDNEGKQLWRKVELKNGEFPKIFPFTKFNLKRIQGDLDLDKFGKPVLIKNGGSFQDKKGRKVNQCGYLIDDKGNVVDIRKKLMFEKEILENDGEIPAVFRTGLLKHDTESELSKLMSEIERSQSEVKQGDGDTSMDSQMQDTPANYNQANQRYEEEGDGEHYAKTSDYEQTKKQKRKQTKRKPKQSTIEFLQPTGREKMVAGAYGGQAIGSIRRPGIKYEKERLEGSKKFRVTSEDEAKVRAQLTNLVKSQSGLKIFQADSEIKLASLLDAHNSQGSVKARQKSSSSQLKKRAPSALSKGSKGGKKKTMNDGDFEQMFGKDIDQFLEDSEWDIQSIDKVSQYSKGGSAQKNEAKLKKMEKLYLKRLEVQGDGRSYSQVEKRASPPKARQTAQDRETIMQVTDDPQIIHRGELLPFTTKKTSK